MPGTTGKRLELFQLRHMRKGPQPGEGMPTAVRVSEGRWHARDWFCSVGNGVNKLL